MGPGVTAVALSVMSVFAALVLTPKVTRDSVIFRGSVVWVLNAPILFLTTDPTVTIVLLGIVATVLAPKELSDKLPYFWLVLLAAPRELQVPIPFPGLQNLIVIDPSKVAVALLLFPAFFLAPVASAARRVSTFGAKVVIALLLLPASFLSPVSNAARRAPMVGVFVVILTLLIVVLDFRGNTFTNGLRQGLDTVLFHGYLFIAITCLLLTRQQFVKLLSAFLFLAIVFSAIAVLTQMKSWDFYGFALQRFGFPVFADIRLGVLRTGGTAVPIVLGYVTILGVLALQYFRDQGRISFLQLWLLRGIFALALYSTFARGAWLALVVALATYYLFTAFPRGLRAPVTIAGLIAVVVAAIYFSQMDLGRFDQYGTFDYRRQMIEAAMIQIQQKPLFGDTNFLTSGNFDHLVQGQGIVDVVNYYLQLALEYGLIVLAIYCLAFVVLGIGLLQLGRAVRETDDRVLECERALMLAVLASYIVMIGTVSNISFVPVIGVLVLAVGAAFVGAVREEMSDGCEVQQQLSSDIVSVPGVSRMRVNNGSL